MMSPAAGQRLPDEMSFTPDAVKVGPTDALVPAEMARKAEDVGARKANTDTASMSRATGWQEPGKSAASP